MTELLQRYFDSGETHFQSGCKASFLQILYHMARRFQESEVLRSEFVQRRQQADRLARLFEYVRVNYAERITVEQAMKLVHMSQSQFMKVFKKVSGMTFVAKTGFPDQSYFDRRFKQAFGKSPRQYRTDLIRRITVAYRAGDDREKHPVVPRTETHFEDNTREASAGTESHWAAAQ
jgi:AraC-like DNA-binding protein